MRDSYIYFSGKQCYRDSEKTDIHLIVLPVSDEPVYAECHKFEEGLNDEDAGKHVVTVLQNLS